MINIGVALSSKYAYKAINQKCPKKAKPDYKMPNGAYSDIEGDEDILVMLLNKYGPVVVAIGKLNVSNLAQMTNTLYLTYTFLQLQITLDLTFTRMACFMIQIVLMIPQWQIMQLSVCLTKQSFS